MSSPYQMQPYRSPWMNEELDIFRQTARRFFENEVAAHEDKWKKNKIIDREVWLKAGELGFLCTSIPEELGGQGATFAHEVVLIEEQCRVVDTAFGLVPGGIAGPFGLMECATPEQAKKWIPKLATGERVLATCITEPGGGSDVKNLLTSARREGNEYVINGSKTFITLGRQSDMAVVAARTGGSGSGAKGISLFMVEDTRNNPGFKLGKALEKVGQRYIDTHEVFFEDMRVPAENLLGGVEGRGFSDTMRGFIKERVVIGVTAIASAERAIELTLEHVKNRKMFGQTLWDFQNTQFKLAECMTEARIGRVFIDGLVQRMVEGDNPPDNVESAMAKWWCSQKQNQIIDECLQFFGGYGYMMEYPIAKLFVDARVQKIYGGSNEVLKRIIGRAL